MASQANNIVVTVVATTNVRVKTGALSEVLGDDPALQAEIVHEAVGLALADRFAGFQGFTVSGATAGAHSTSATAKLDIDELGASLRRMIASYDRMYEALTTARVRCAELATLQAEIDAKRMTPDSERMDPVLLATASDKVKALLAHLTAAQEVADTEGVDANTAGTTCGATTVALASTDGEAHNSGRGASPSQEAGGATTAAAAAVSDRGSRRYAPLLRADADAGGDVGQERGGGGLEGDDATDDAESDDDDVEPSRAGFDRTGYQLLE